MEDLTLQIFLLRELPCSPLSSADHVSLAALDMPGSGTLADHVDPAHFEHIRLKPETSFDLDVIHVLVKRYYQELRYDIEVDRTLSNSFAMLVRRDSHHLSIAGMLEEEGNLNVTVV